MNVGNLPKGSHFRTVLGIGNFPMTGKQGGHASGFPATHGVGLSGETERPGPGTANLPGRQMQIDEAAIFVGAVTGLVEPLTPKGKNAGRRSKGLGSSAELRFGNMADFGDPLRGIILNPRLEFIPAFGMSYDIFPINEIFPDQDMEHAVEQRDIRTGLQG